MPKRTFAVLAALLFAFCLVVTGCSDKDREGGSTPTGETTDVTFKFNLDIDAVEGKTTVPCNVAYFVFYGYVGDATEPVYEYQKDKDKVEKDGQPQTVTLPDVPTSVTRFVIKYMAADDKQVAETTVNDVDLTTTTEPTFVIDEETPIEAAKLTVKFAGTQPTEATKYSVAMYDSTYVNIYNLAKDSVPFKEFSLEDIPLNLSYLIISWYDSTDNVIAATVADEDTNPEIKTLKIGESTTITITGDPITTGFVAVAMDSDLQVPDTAKKYCVNICDSGNTTLKTSGDKNVPYERQYFEEVPNTAVKAYVEFKDASNNVVAQGSKALATVVPGSMQIVTIDKFTPALKLINCYAGDTAIETVSYTVVDKDGKKTEGTTPFSAEGTYDIPISTADSYISVASVVLKDKDTGDAFEWFDYAEPMEGVILTADTKTNNEFANGAYVNDNTECLVANPRQLNGVRNHLGGKFKQTQDIDFGNSCGIEIDVEEEAGIKAYCAKAINKEAPFYHIFPESSYDPVAGAYATVYGWVPIGGKIGDTWEDPHPFTGSYDGAGFAIKNLKCDRRKGNECASRTGLFGTVDGATLTGINVDNTCTFIAHATTGSIVGTAQNFTEAKKTTVSNCHSGATIYNYENGGGIVGAVKNYEEVVSVLDIDNCTYSGKFVGQGVYQSGSQDCGFFAGILGFVGANAKANISDCIFSGSIENNDLYTTQKGLYLYRVGGILSYGEGNTEVTITDCTNAGTMEFKTWESGGAVGYFYGKELIIDNFQLTGTMKMELLRKEKTAIGGIVGRSTVIPTFEGVSKCGENYKVGDTATCVGGIIGLCDDQSEEDVAAALSGKVETKFDGDDETNYRGKYCGSPFVQSL